MRDIVVARRETSFTAAVRDGAPHRWTALDTSLDLHGALRLFHIAYLPPASLEELQVYESQHAKQPPASAYSVRAVVRTVTASNKVEDFVVVCFPLDVRRLTSASALTLPTGNTAEVDGAAPAPGAAGPSPAYSLASLTQSPRTTAVQPPSQLLLPVSTDIATGLNIRLALDGFTELRVEGPGTVVFTGSQRLVLMGQRRREADLY